MKQIHFYKMCGTGNDFVLVDNRKKVIRNHKQFARDVCDRHRGIGADGVVFIEQSHKADLTMRIINADGSEAEMCGNGIRCATWLAHNKFGCAPKLSFQTIAGVIPTEVKKDVVKVQLPEPTDFRDYAPLEVKDGIFYFYYINTGVPHCVIFEDKLEEFPVERIGREIRYHPHFQPEGANVNFVHVKNKQTIAVRTYERGVERETMACGTGSTASAIVSALVEKCTSPVTVMTKSGERLMIHFKRSTFKITDIFLEGSVNFIFEGDIT